MGNKEVEGKRKKKKGRPSLLDIQKRSLRLQKSDQKQFQKPKPSNPNFTNPNPHHHGRITRRNSNPDTIASDKIGSDNEDDDDNDDEEEENGKRQREKKLNLVLRKNPNQKSFSNSQCLDPQLYGSDLDDDDEEPVENAEALQKLKKQKIDGSGYRDGKKVSGMLSGEKHTSGLIGTGTPLESGPTTPLPDKKLLFFILDRLQKKDTYGVFSDPVDPEELPDYHDIIDHPMDFGTVRKKLDTGVYASLEQFEKDVLLISSNAMQYNAPDTIYFRQARSIQELARKNFEELRQDSDDNEPEAKIETKIEPKVVRRGRPPGRPPGTKNVKKTPGKASFDSTSDATLARGGESSNWSNSYNLRRGPLPNKYSPNDLSRTYHGSRNVENYTRWSAERTSERNAGFHGSFMKGFSTKYGKMHVPEENRRDTYMNPSLLVGEPSVLSTFEADQIQLMPVGLHMEHGYAKSLARFAADLGPVAWKVAAKKIERSLPPGTRFGPGWVGESEAPSQAQTLSAAEPSSPIVETTSTFLASVEPKVDKLAEQEPTNNATSDCLSNKILHPSTMTPPSVAINRSLELPTYVEADRGVNSNSGFESINCTPGGTSTTSTPFRIHESPALNPAMNGLNSVFGFNNQSQMGKSDRAALSNGSYSSEPSIHSRIFDMARNSFVNSMPVNRLESSLDNSKLPSNFVMNSCSTSNSGHMVQAGSLAGLNPWRGLPMQQKVDSVPPDLNLRFQSSGSPSSSVRIDSPQPDLALQL